MYVTLFCHTFTFYDSAYFCSGRNCSVVVEKSGLYFFIRFVFCGVLAIAITHQKNIFKYLLWMSWDALTVWIHQRKKWNYFIGVSSIVYIPFSLLLHIYTIENIADVMVLLVVQMNNTCMTLKLRSICVAR